MLKRAGRNKTNGTRNSKRTVQRRPKSASKAASLRKPASRGRVSAKSRPAPKALSSRRASQAASGRARTGESYQASLKNFEVALGYFRKRQYEKATTLFEKVATSSVQELAERARMHLRLCERKTRQAAAPRTAEEHYLRGIAALNSRDTELAIQLFNKSDKMAPKQEHVHYALAAAHGLQGDLDAALTHLQKAIELRPANRVQARLDEDFQPLAADPRFGRLVGLSSS